MLARVKMPVPNWDWLGTVYSITTGTVIRSMAIPARHLPPRRLLGMFLDRMPRSQQTCSTLMFLENSQLTMALIPTALMVLQGSLVPLNRLDLPMRTTTAVMPLWLEGLEQPDLVLTNL